MQLTDRALILEEDDPLTFTTILIKDIEIIRFNAYRTEFTLGTRSGNQVKFGCTSEEDAIQFYKDLQEAVLNA